MSLKSLVYAKISLASDDRASSSASVVEVVTVVCCRDRQSTGPPNNVRTKLSVLRQVARSSAKAASEAARKDPSAEKNKTQGACAIEVRNNA